MANLDVEVAGQREGFDFAATVRGNTGGLEMSERIDITVLQS